MAEKDKKEKKVDEIVFTGVGGDLEEILDAVKEALASKGARVLKEERNPEGSKEAALEVVERLMSGKGDKDKAHRLSKKFSELKETFKDGAEKFAKSGSKIPGVPASADPIKNEVIKSFNALHQALHGLDHLVSSLIDSVELAEVVVKAQNPTAKELEEFESFKGCLGGVFQMVDDLGRTVCTMSRTFEHTGVPGLKDSPSTKEAN